MNQIKGRASLQYDRPPKLIGAASIVGSKEGDGPLGHLFDCIEQIGRASCRERVCLYV